MADVNGDRRQDVVAFGEDGVWLALSTGTGFAAPTFVIAGFGYNQGWRVENHVRLMADVNGDGRQDLVAFGKDGVWTALSTGTGFTAPTFVVAHFGYNEGWRVDKNPRFLVDLNDDGYLDIVGYGNEAVFRALGGSTGFGEFRMMLRSLGVVKAYQSDEAVEVGQQFVADVNGNGMQDLVVFTDKSIAVALSSDSPPRPPPAAPTNLRVTYRDSSSIHFAWSDNSTDERLFLFTFWKLGDAKHTVRLGANSTMWAVGQEADTTYCSVVWAENLWGFSLETPGVCGRTNPDTGGGGGGGPEQKTTDVILSRHLGEPYIPYAAEFPAGGLPIVGTLKQITNLDIPLQHRRIAIVRLNHSTTECGDPNAIVMLNPGESTTPETMKTIYGTSTPSLPVPFVACTDNPPPGQLFIRIIYIEQ
jgi:hypothetical protein